MKSHLKLIITFWFAVFLLTIQTSHAQYQIGLVPRVSPDKSVSQKIGYTEVEVNYGSPSVNKRTLWGDLVPYNAVWRAGANNATNITFHSDVLIDHNTVDSGSYAFFLIPKQNDKWTLILYKTAKQWGAFRYDQNEDALRLEVIPQKKETFTDDLTYSIQQTGFQYGSIVMEWGYIKLELPFETNYLKAFEEEVEKRVSAQPDYLKWIAYLQGAEHLQATNLNPDLAHSWINKSEEIMDKTTEWNDQFYPRDYVKGHVYWTKAKIQADRSNYTEALKYGKKLKELNNTLFFERNNESEEIEKWILVWEEKS